MSAAWWGQGIAESHGAGSARSAAAHARPGRDAVRAAVEARIAAFTPEWRRRTPGDAGDALAESARRARRAAARATQSHAGEGLPRIPALRGRRGRGRAAPRAPRSRSPSPTPRRPARSFRRVSRSRRLRPTVPASAWCSRPRRRCTPRPARSPSTFVQDGNRFFEVPLTGTDPAANNLVFGSAPRPGAALLIGLSGDVAPGPNITFMIHRSASAGAPPAIAHGGLGAGCGRGAAHPALELLRWRPLRDRRNHPRRVARAAAERRGRAALPAQLAPGHARGRGRAETAALAAAAARGGRVRDASRRLPSSS